MRSSVDVCNYLQSKGVQHELVTLSGPVKNAISMAEILGLEPREVIKTLLFIADANPVMVLIPGDCRADKSKIKRHLGAGKITFAAESEIRELAEYMATALPPVGLKSEVTTIIDVRIKPGDTVYTAGGSPNVILKLRAVDLIEVTAAAAVDVAE